MRRLTLALVALSGIGLMIAKQLSTSGTELPMADGESSATVLPADRAASKTAFQTATFGLG